MEIIDEKRPVYTQKSGDVIRNFRVSAAMKNSTPGSELATHLLKQIGAVVNLLCDPSVQDSEAQNRFADARNYIDLAYTMYMEGKAHERVV